MFNSKITTVFYSDTIFKKNAVDSSIYKFCQVPKNWWKLCKYGMSYVAWKTILEEAKILKIIIQLSLKIFLKKLQYEK